MTFSGFYFKRVRALAMLLWAYLIFLPVAAQSDPTAPSASHRQVTLAVSALLHRDHLSGHRIDDEISQRCSKAFLEMLDPMKLYFYQSDVDRFMAYRNELDDLVKRGDVNFAYDVFRTFLQRVDERLMLVDGLLSGDHDFTIDEAMVTDWDEATYPKTPEDAKERWRKRVKYDLLVLKVDDTDPKEAVEKLRKRYNSFAKRMHQTNSEDLLEMYLTSLTTAFDPHTTYMSPSTLENFEIAMRLELEGIGASLKSEDGYVVVHKVVRGGAADKDGRLHVGDKIIAVGQGKTGEMIDILDMRLSDVVKKIRGKRGTVVRLKIEPVDSKKTETIEITRARIELSDREAFGKIYSHRKSPEGQIVGLEEKPDGELYKIGVIDLPSFYMDMAGARRGLQDYKSTTRDVRRILEEFNESGVDAVVLDLRANGGGSLTEAINLTGLFIDEGLVVQVKDSDGRIHPYHDLDRGVAWSGPLVVLTSKFSASASEILAGAIKDYGRGLIVGDRATHGKGTVQSLLDLGNQLFRIPNAPKMGALKVTMQQFYRPNGASTQNRGVLADVEWPSMTSHLDVGESDLDYPVAFDRVKPQQFDKLGQMTDSFRRQLNEMSKRRCAESEDFQKVVEKINKYKKQKEQKYVTLNEKKFMEERAGLKDEKQRKKELDDPDRPRIKEDFYLDEAMNIAADYVQVIRQSDRLNAAADKDSVTSSWHGSSPQGN